MVPASVVFASGSDPRALPEGAAVYLIRPREGQPYLGRTNILRRRMTRLIAKWKLAEMGAEIEYWLVASRLEQWLLSYDLGRFHFPDTYERLLRLPKPSYVKLALTNEFARTQVTTRLAGSKNLFFGPFPNRASADLFESQFLDFYQLRRCQEDLAPSPEHPGCIYGEMLKCLRPCQEAVSREEYASEARRVGEFLSSRGSALLDSIEAARDRASQDLNFEEAARQHTRLDKATQIVKLAGDLAHEVTRLHGVAVTGSTRPQEVLLWFLREGCWLRPQAFSIAPGTGKPVSMDTRLREAASQLEMPKLPLSQRQEHVALLAKWYFSSWRDGEWIGFESLDALPYRKLVNAISRVAKQTGTVIS